jgi:hypothetical protein
MAEHINALRQHPPRLKKAKKKKRKGKYDKSSRKQVNPAAKLSYAEYLLSPWWKSRSRQAKIKARWKCQRCGGKSGLQAHHRHYDTLGCERDCDLEVLCRACHEATHECWAVAMNHLDSIVGR